MTQYNGYQGYLRGHSRAMHTRSSARDAHGVPLLQLSVDADTLLRVFAEEDAATLFALTDQNRSYLRQWLPWLDSTRSVADSMAFILDELARYHANHGFSCGIWYRGQLVGNIGFHDIHWQESRVEVGYWLSALFQGKGLMTNACRAMIDYAFNVLHLKQVDIRCAPGNSRSRAIPQRLGFQEMGLVEHAEWLYDHFVDLVVYSMRAEVWQARTR